MNEEQTTETSVEEVTDLIYDEYQFYTMMYNSFEEFRIDNTEQNELIVYDMNRLAAEVEEYQQASMILEMLTCGLIGIIIGVCLVNIFKKR